MGTGPAAVPAATPPLAQPSRRTVELGAVRRAARVAIAACVAFYTCQYLLGASVTALYALFTVIALGALSDVQGSPRQRAHAYLGAVAAGLPLVTLGTYAAVSTWVAAAGMLAVGFAVAYSGVGGPRVAGVANGLQLFYVLPCFPPFAPDTLGQRLAGLVVGGLLLAAVDRWLWPVTPPAPPGTRLAKAAGQLAEYAAHLDAGLRAPAGSVGASGLAAPTTVEAAAATLRLTQLPTAERPLGPGIQDRSLLAAGNATRTAAMRLATLGELLAAPGARPHRLVADLVAATGAAFAGMAAALRRSADGIPGPPDACVDGSEALEAALKAYLDHRDRGGLDALASPAELRIALTAVYAADEARKAVLATGGFLRAAPPRPEQTPPSLWFLHAGRVELWWRRLLGHLTPRSVYLQNAVRLALGLAVARVVAGSLDLAHGFWVLLATLSLMRTSAVAGRSAMLRAFAGTVAGAIVAGAMLTLVGPHTWVYVWALPPIMVVAFAAGPLLGVAAAQAGFTVVVAMLFAQLAPADWRLAEVRLEDVLVGGLVGAVIGAAVWPRGGGGEIRRVAAAGLRAGAAEIESTIAQLVGDPAPPADMHQLAMMFDHTYAQFRTEPAPPGPDPDWYAVLGVVHRLDGYGTLLRDRHPPAAQLPWPEIAAALRAAAADVATAYRDAADAIAAGRPLPADAGNRCRSRFRTGDDVHGLQSTPSVVGRVLDGWGWLNGLADDLELLERAFAAPAAGPAGKAPADHGADVVPGDPPATSAR